jgi:integrase
VPPHKKPGTADTARARHRRYQLQCTQDLTEQLTPTALLALALGMPVERNLSHHQAVCWPHLNDWLDWLDFEGKRPRTLQAYEWVIAALLRNHPTTDLEEFTHQTLIRELAKYPQRTRYIQRSIYNQFFDWAYRDERVDRNPMGRVPKLKRGARRPTDRFDLGEVALLEALPAPHGQLMQLLFGTGIRRNEACHLQRGHIDLQRLRLTVYDGKGGKDDIVPLTPELVIAVADLDLLERLEPSDHLWFLSRYPVGDKRRRRDPISSPTFGRWWEDALEAAGVRYLSPHKTRHTFHWLMREAGYDLEERQLLMRHKSSDTTTSQYPAVDIADVARKRSGLG